MSESRLRQFANRAARLEVTVRSCGSKDVVQNTDHSTSKKKNEKRPKLNDAGVDRKKRKPSFLD